MDNWRRNSISPHDSSEGNMPSGTNVIKRKKYYRAIAKWLEKWLIVLQATFATLGFFVIFLPTISSAWRSVIEKSILFDKMFYDYSTFSGLAMINLYMGMFVALAKPYWSKHTPSGDLIKTKKGTSSFRYPRTKREEISFLADSIALILVTSVWLFLPFGMVAYFIDIGR